jgi:hypothetical protein
MAKLPMTKLMVLAALIIFSAYTPGAFAARDVQSCQNKCAERMQQCLAKSSERMPNRPAAGMSNTPPPMGISNMPPMGMSKSQADTTPYSKCSDGNQACLRACK